MNTQVNISIPSEWKDELERLARIFSVEEETTLNYLDLIRRAVKEKYDLSEDEEQTDGKFVSTVGKVSEATILRYIQEQKGQK